MNKFVHKIRFFLLLFFISGSLLAQSKYTSVVSLKSIQADITSLLLINGASLYGDVDFFKRKSGFATYGIRAGIAVVDFNSIAQGNVEGFPVRNLSAGIRASTKISSYNVNSILSYVNTRSLSKSPERKNGINLLLNVEVEKYFKSGLIGLKFKFQLPAFHFDGEYKGGYIGFGIVFGYLSK
jgi:hypothetical protein